MNTHQPDILGNSSNWKQGDLYENIETRPGTTEKQKEAGQCAYTELLEAHARWAGGTLLGSHFPKDFHEQGGTTLLNQSIKSGYDLAVMTQILRDPRFETFRIFYTQQQRIVHHTAITSRLPGAIYLEEIGHDKHDLGKLLDNTKRQVHADGYWVLHNHPSGNATPSYQDVCLTVHLASKVSGFKGHVVINTNEYCVIDKDGLVDHVYDMGNQAGGYLNNPFKQHELLLERISSPKDLARIGKALKQCDQFFQLIGISARNTVLSITELPISVLDRSKNLLLARLQNFTRNFGVNAVFAITDSHHFKHPVLVVACQAGILRDVLTADGAKYRSMQEEAIFPSVGGEISSCYRKPRSFLTENDGIIKSKGRGVRL